MPSPFPGIDPYLESQGYWPDFHVSFIPYFFRSYAVRGFGRLRKGRAR